MSLEFLPDDTNTLVLWVIALIAIVAIIVLMVVREVLKRKENRLPPARQRHLPPAKKNRR